jgi:hypothetical protein
MLVAASRFRHCVESPPFHCAPAFLLAQALNQALRAPDCQQLLKSEASHGCRAEQAQHIGCSVVAPRREFF